MNVTHLLRKNSQYFKQNQVVLFFLKHENIPQIRILTSSAKLTRLRMEFTRTCYHLKRYLAFYNTDAPKPDYYYYRCYKRV